MGNLIDYCRQHKKIFCYGAGHYGRVIHNHVLEAGFELDGFIVTKKEKNSTLQGRTIYDLDELNAYENDIGIIIGVGSKYSKEIIEKLSYRGYHDAFYIQEDSLNVIENNLSYNLTPLSPAICVLYYHRVCNIPIDTWNLAVPTEVFEQHIEYLKNNFKIARFDDDWQNIQDPTIVITIDDGYSDIWSNAYPILEKNNVPATVFVSTGCMDKKEEFWSDKLEQIFFYNKNMPDDFVLEGNKFSLRTEEDRKKGCYYTHTWLKQMGKEERDKSLIILANMLHSKISARNTHRVMSSEELRNMSVSKLITIGGHTISHTSLASETEEIQQEEINLNKKSIEQIIGKTIDVFSYPFGGNMDYTEQTKTIVMNAGYKKIASTRCGIVDTNTDLFDIPRICISGDCSVKELEKRIKKTWCYYGS